MSGWEGADWFAGEGRTPDPGPMTWGRPSWWAHWEAEHRAVREGVALMDMSFMAKFHVEGRDAGRVLSRLSANHVDGEAGRITYTQWLNEQGTLEADLTVTKLDDARFLVVASDTAHRHVEARLRRAVGDAHAFVSDVTGGTAQLNVQGPHSRALLEAVTGADLSNAAFPFRAARTLEVGFARVLATRITYLGELGWELFIPAEQAVHVYRTLREAGERFGVRPAGLKALASLRLEKGYRDYGHDLDNTDTPLETGLGFAVAWDKPGGFVGREALLALRDQPRRRALVQVVLEEATPLLFHAEPVLRDGKAVGSIRSASYGFTLGAAVGLAMVDGGDTRVDARWLADGRWEVDVSGVRHRARTSLRPLYDPENTRIKA